MKLLDRYLKEVRQSMFLTSTATRNDILRELEEELRAQFEGREEELGRPLTESEADQILQRFGHPLVVAGRYREGKGTLSFGRQLIGPELFPLYRLILVVNLALTAIVIAAFSLALEAGDGVGEELVAQLALQAGIITVIFIAVETTMRRKIRRGWSMLEKKEPEEKNFIPRSSSVTEIIFTIFFAHLWVELPSFPDPLRLANGETWSAGPVWTHFHSTFFIPVFIVLMGSIAISFLNLLDPYRRSGRLRLSAIANIAFAGMVGVTLAAHWTTLVAQTNAIRLHEAMSTMEKTNFSTNLSVAWFLGIFALVALCEAILEIHRAAQLQEGDASPDSTIHTAAL